MIIQGKFLFIDKLKLGESLRYIHKSNYLYTYLCTEQFALSIYIFFIIIFVFLISLNQLISRT